MIFRARTADGTEVFLRQIPSRGTCNINEFLDVPNKGDDDGIPEGRELTPRLFFLVSSWQLAELELVLEWPKENMTTTRWARRSAGRRSAGRARGRHVRSVACAVPECGHVAGRRSPPPSSPGDAYPRDDASSSSHSESIMSPTVRRMARVPPTETRAPLPGRFPTRPPARAGKGSAHRGRVFGGARNNGRERAPLRGHLLIWERVRRLR